MIFNMVLQLLARRFLRTIHRIPVLYRPRTPMTWYALHFKKSTQSHLEKLLLQGKALAGQIMEVFLPSMMASHMQM